MSEYQVISSLDAPFGHCSLFSDRVVLVTMAEGLNLDAEVGQRGIPELEAFVGPGPYVAVVDGRRIGYVPREGREAVRQSIGSHRIATCFIVSEDASQWLANRFLNEEQPLEGAVFTSEDEALEWAHRRMRDVDSPPG